jgi:TonB family protein
MSLIYEALRRAQHSKQTAETPPHPVSILEPPSLPYPGHQPIETTSPRSDPAPFWHWDWRSTTFTVLLPVVSGFVIHRRPHSAPSATPSEGMPANELGLNLKRSDTDWEVRWNRNIPALLRAKQGHLSIVDGAAHRELTLTADELQSGSILYSPLTNDVLIRLRVEDGNVPIQESVRILGVVRPVFDSAAARNRTVPRSATIPNGFSKKWAVSRSEHKPRGLPTAVLNATDTTPIKTPAPLESIPSQGNQLLDSVEKHVRSAPEQNDTLAGMRAAQPIAERLSVRSEAGDFAPPNVIPTPFQRGGVVVPPQLKVRTEPIYPEMAKRVGFAGSVEVRFRITTSGNVREVEVVKGNPILAQAAIDAVRTWRYNPATLNDKPFETDGNAIFQFQPH